MPIIKSAVKRTRQAKKRRAYNVAVKSSVKGKTKTFKADLTTDLKKAHDSLIIAISELDRAVKRGTLHKRTVARRKSRLTKQYNALADQPYGVAKASKTKPTATKTSSAKTTKSKATTKKSSPANKK